jgi:hypothetical protein
MPLITNNFWKKRANDAIVYLRQNPGASPIQVLKAIDFNCFYNGRLDSKARTFIYELADRNIVESTKDLRRHFDSTQLTAIGELFDVVYEGKSERVEAAIVRADKAVAELVAIGEYFTMKQLWDKAKVPASIFRCLEFAECLHRCKEASLSLASESDRRRIANRGLIEPQTSLYPEVEQIQEVRTAIAALDHRVNIIKNHVAQLEHQRSLNTWVSPELRKAITQKQSRISVLLARRSALHTKLEALEKQRVSADLRRFRSLSVG